MKNNNIFFSTTHKNVIINAITFRLSLYKHIKTVSSALCVCVCAISQIRKFFISLKIFYTKKEKEKTKSNIYIYNHYNISRFINDTCYY